MRGRGLVICAFGLLAFAVASAASAGGWLPHPADDSVSTVVLLK